MPDLRLSRYLVSVTFEVAVPPWASVPTPTAEAAEAAALAVCGEPCAMSRVSVEVTPVGTTSARPRVPRRYKARRTR